MAAFSDNFQRRVIPSWHDSREQELHQESASLRPVNPRSQQDNSGVRNELLQTPTLGIAVDALNASIAAGDHDTAKIAAEIVHGRGAGLPDPVREMARRVLDVGEADLPIIQPFLHVHHQRIAELRQLIRVYPLSPLLYLDLARNFVPLAETDKALRAVLTALTLAPNNRTVLRAAARFFSCIEEKERAYYLVRDASVTKNDPWLISAEIALGQIAGKSPRHWKSGKDFLLRGALPPFHLSELATAAGTLELMSGNTKDAKKFFRQGMIAPTGNSLAQIQWAERRLGATLVPSAGSLPTDRSRAFEAEFLRYYTAGNMPKALECGKGWFFSQPFSSVAASATSFVAAFLDDYETVERFSRYALYGNRGTPNLRNNLIYAEISSGKIFREGNGGALHRLDKVTKELRSYVALGGYTGVHALANSGLLAFRLRQPDDGRRLYERAIEMAQKLNEPIAAANAAVFLAREALLAGAPWAQEALSRARLLVKPVVARAGAAPGVEFYMRKVDELDKNPADAATILSPAGADKAITVPPALPLRVTTNADGVLTVWIPPRR